MAAELMMMERPKHQALESQLSMLLSLRQWRSGVFGCGFVLTGKCEKGCRNGDQQGKSKNHFLPLSYEPAEQATAYSLGREPQVNGSKVLKAHEVGDSRGSRRPFHGLGAAPNLTRGSAFSSTPGFMLTGGCGGL
jgi:hypothetical protein